VTCVLGLDIGGSATRGRAAVDGETVAEASGPAANVTAVGEAAAAEVLRSVIAQLRGSLPRAPDAVCAGAAGSAIRGPGEWLRATLSQLSGAARVQVVPDAALILPAAGHDTGLAVVCGTGSIVYGSDGRHIARAGGWGYLLGDAGGAYRLVVESLRVLLDRRDRGEPLGPLKAALAGEGGLDELLAGFYADPRPRRWAALAPALLACGDPGVQELVRSGAGAVARDAGAVAGRLALGRGAPIVLAGGLVADERVRERLRCALADALPGSCVEVLTAAPVEGALVLAREVASR
jgi:N-acetylglucosamine kinase-like BadF-type ATPase